MVYKDNAIVLKMRDFGESDRIVTLLLEKSGKKGVIAKSIRKPKSRKASSVDIGNILQVSNVKTKSIDILSETKVIFSPTYIPTDLVKISILNVVMEITEKLVFEEMDETSKYYILVSEFIELLDKSTIKLNILLYATIIKLLEISGFVSSEDIKSKLSPRSYKSMIYMLKAELSLATKLKLTDNDINEIEMYIKSSLDDVLERKVKSFDFFFSIQNDINKI